MKEINANKETLKRNLLDLIELQYILYKTQVFFEEVREGVGGGEGWGGRGKRVMRETEGRGGKG